jgi:DNA mismatch repair ATPase MutL
VAQVCRRLWKRISGRLAVLRSGLKDPAVKLGDKLSYEEMEALIKEWLSSRYPATCPHGRSICYRIEHKDIARKLDRH